MAPATIEPAVQLPIQTKSIPSAKPIRAKGNLDSFESFDVTPIIGREFPKANLVEWLNAPNSDELLRDLAVTSTSQDTTWHPDILFLTPAPAQSLGAGSRLLPSTR